MYLILKCQPFRLFRVHLYNRSRAMRVAGPAVFIFWHYNKLREPAAPHAYVTIYPQCVIVNGSTSTVSNVRSWGRFCIDSVYS